MSAVTWIDELAELIADKCDDDGGLIMEAFSKALVLVGFDHDAEIVDQMIAAYEGGMMPRFTLTWKPADDHPLFGANDPAKLPEDDPNYIPF